MKLPDLKYNSEVRVCLNCYSKIFKKFNKTTKERNHRQLVNKMAIVADNNLEVAKRKWLIISQRYKNFGLTYAHPDFIPLTEKNPVFRRHILDRFSPKFMQMNLRSKSHDLLCKLPKRVILNIFSLLSFRDIQTLRRCSKTLRMIVDDGFLWKRLYFKKYPNQIGIVNSTNWRALYIETELLDCSLLEYSLRYDLIPLKQEYDNDRITHVVGRMNFSKLMNRDDLYVESILRLSSLHTELKNFHEAANCLLVLANELDWSRKKLDRLGPFPPDYSYARKESLCMAAAELFSAAKQWEKAEALVQEVLNQMEKRNSTQSTSSVLKQRSHDLRRQEIGDFKSKLRSFGTSKERFPHSYFLLEFGGPGWKDLDVRTIIVRAGELEKLSDFVRKIKARYEVQIIFDTNTLDSTKAIERWIQITSCRPSNETVMNSPEILNVSVNDQISKDTNIFVYTRTFRKPVGKSDTLRPRNELADLWVSQNFVKTKSTFPQIEMISPVIFTHKKEISPLDNAVQILSEKNEELQNVIEKAETSGVWSSNFTMILKGVIDAAVNGGVTKYRQAFFMNASGLDQTKLNQLKDLLSKQVDILTRGMKIHAKIRPTNLEALHTQLERLLQTMRISSENVANAKFEEVLMSAPPMYNEKSRQESVWLELHAFYQNARERAEKEPIVVRLQSFYRSYVQRKQFIKQKSAVLLIQANFRGHMLRRTQTQKLNTTNIQKIAKPKREIKIESSLRVLTAPRRESNFEDMVAAGFLPPGVVLPANPTPIQHTQSQPSKVGAHFQMSQLSESRKTIVNALTSPAKKEIPNSTNTPNSTTNANSTLPTTMTMKVELATALTNTNPHRFIPVVTATSTATNTPTSSNLPPNPSASSSNVNRSSGNLANNSFVQNNNNNANSLQPVKIGINDRTPSWRASKGTKRDSVDEDRPLNTSASSTIVHSNVNNGNLTATNSNNKSATAAFVTPPPSPTFRIGETRDVKK